MKLAMLILAWLLLIWTGIVISSHLWMAITCKTTKASEGHLLTVLARVPTLVFFIYYVI